MAIVLLMNGEQTSSNAITDGILAILQGKEPEMVKVPVMVELGKILVNGKAEQAVQRYHDLRKDYFDQYDFSEIQLNRLGYVLLDQERVGEAIEIFRLNVEMFPRSFNPYDSLGEAYMIAGDKEKAIENYQKSLELNPENENGKRMLKKLTE
jgi:tetratricopeptide (TPR) repeat protein